jgi:salicylate hydroxylase
MSSAASDHLHVAIIGAGITGVNLALGLQARNVSYAIYERTSAFREIGAGIGFSPNAERAMGLLNPDVLAAFKRVANPNGEDYFQWVNGHGGSWGSAEPLFKLHVGKDGFQGARRSDILDEWTKLMPPSVVHFGKELNDITEPDSPSDKLILRFTDGTTALADAVIGCDGIHSRVRQLMLRPPLPQNEPEPIQLPPSAYPGYTQKFCFRALAPMPEAVAAIGEHKATTRFMYIGPGQHVITYPVANNTLLNILVVMSDPSPVWLHTDAAGRDDDVPALTKLGVVEAFMTWHPTVRKIIDLLPDEELSPWAIFDMAEHPAPYYARGRVCVAGDAAHATGPHLGAGGGMGVEDALALAGLLAEVDGRVRRREGERGLVERALGVYNAVRYGRTQEVVQSTRAACDLFHRRGHPDSERFGREITVRFHKIWEYAVDLIVEDALGRLDDVEEVGDSS